MTDSEKLTRICKILRSRFPNIDNMDIVNLAYKILEVINE